MKRIDKPKIALNVRFRFMREPPKEKWKNARFIYPARLAGKA
jgi:hypothetical protein